MLLYLTVLGAFISLIMSICSGMDKRGRGEITWLLIGLVLTGLALMQLPPD